MVTIIWITVLIVTLLIEFILFKIDRDSYITFGQIFLVTTIIAFAISVLFIQDKTKDYSFTTTLNGKSFVCYRPLIDTSADFVFPGWIIETPDRDDSHARCEEVEKPEQIPYSPEMIKD